jgi:hypothetical protein
MLATAHNISDKRCFFSSNVLQKEKRLRKNKPNMAYIKRNCGRAKTRKVVKTKNRLHAVTEPSFRKRRMFPPPKRKRG